MCCHMLESSFLFGPGVQAESCIVFDIVLCFGSLISFYNMLCVSLLDAVFDYFFLCCPFVIK